jgi:hypothetical protein
MSLDCLTVMNVFGIKVTFHNLCDHQATITEMNADTLPASLPVDSSFVMGLNVTVLFEGQIVEDLPNGTGVQLDFPISANTQDQYAVLLWSDEDGDGEGVWLEAIQLIKIDELNKVMSTDAEDELYRIAPTEAMKMFYQMMTAGKTGTFVLVKK